MKSKLILASSLAGILVVLFTPWYVPWGNLPGGGIGYGPPVYGYEYLQREFTSVVLPLTWAPWSSAFMKATSWYTSDTPAAGSTSAAWPTYAPACNRWCSARVRSSTGRQRTPRHTGSSRDWFAR